MTDDPRALAAQLLAASRFAMPREEALEHIRARRAELTALSPAPTPDIAAPEAMPSLVDAPEEFAAAFWQRRRSPPLPQVKPRKPRTGRSSPPSPTTPPTLRVIGGKDHDGDNTELPA